MVERLNTKAKLYRQIEEENALMQNTLKEEYIKDIYCGIVPTNETVKYKADYVTNTKKHTYITHKIIIRVKSAEIDDTMFFLINNKRYYVVAYDLDYKYKDKLIIYCEVEQ